MMATMPRPIDPRRIEVIDDAMAAIYRAMTPAQRVAITCDANRTARLMLAAQIRRLHLDWSDEQVTTEVARRMLHG